MTTIRPLTAALGVAVLASATGVGAGSWSQLPEAVTLLQRQVSDGSAGGVIAAAESSVVAEAASGHLAAVPALIGVYAELVAPLPDGEARLELLHRRTARALVAWGDSRSSVAPRAAGQAWALAARYHPEPIVLGRLRRLLLPPADSEPGDTWVSPVDGAELVLVPGLGFVMGCTEGDRTCLRNERTSRRVEVPAFWLERAEVSRRRYGRCVEAGVCTPPVAGPVAFGGGSDADLAVTGVTWHQARTFAIWAGRRLPSESEWERAARGHRPEWRYPWGSAADRSSANFLGTVLDDAYQSLAPVGSFPATAWGLYDLSGNVWEWCDDVYHENLIAAPRDGRPRTEGGRGRVLRGGSWRRGVDYGRVSSRTWEESDYAADDVGFRCAVGAAAELTDLELGALASLAFSVRAQPGRELALAALDTADRRYLERRTVTWLVLEGRSAKALQQAAGLLRREPRDPAGNDLLDRVEGQLMVSARRGEASRVEEILTSYRVASSGSSRLGSRLAAIEERLVVELRDSASASRRRGERESAGVLLRLALTLAPGDRQLQGMLRSVLPAAGAEKTWAGDSKTMVWVPGGSSIMGAVAGDKDAASDELPAHTVEVRGFWLDRTEVTNAEYRRCVDAAACTAPHRTIAFNDPGRSDHPVLWVDWYQARQYARWAGKRLPTETEWEHAARAGQPRRYPWGDDWRDGLANTFSERGRDTWSDTSPVGSFAANEWGLVDMVGNAWEWVEDGYHQTYHGAPADGRAWKALVGGVDLANRVLRGGAFHNFPPKTRISQRNHRPPDSPFKSTGFRCAATP